MAPLAPDAIKLAKRLPPESTFSFPLTSHERVHFLAFLELTTLTLANRLCTKFKKDALKLSFLNFVHKRLAECGVVS